jgi:predicted small metal-binding protein
MAKAVTCVCGWHEHGAEEELVEDFVQHVEEARGKQISREAAVARVEEEGE